MNKLISFFFLILFLFLAYQSFQSPFFTIQKVEVLSNIPSSHFQASVQSHLERLKGQSLLKLSLSDIVQSMNKKPIVERSWAWRHFPDTLRVRVHFQEPLLSLLHEGKNKLFPVAFDGNLLEVNKENRSLDLPILRGKPFLKSSEKRKQVFRMVAQMPPQGLFGRDKISEIYYLKNKLTFQLLERGNRVILSPETFTLQTVNRVGKVLNYLFEKGLEDCVIDGRFSKKIVVKLRK